MEFCYIDNSNIFIEGQRVSAVRRKQAEDMDAAIRNGIQDQQYRLDFGKLYEFAVGFDLNQVGRAMLFGSRPPANDHLWTIAQDVGFEVIVEDRNLSNKEKRVDTGLTFELTRDAYRSVEKSNDRITLVAGDGDYVPVVKNLVDDGFNVEVFFWNHCSRDLRDAASKFVSLDQHYLEIGSISER